MPKGEDFVIKCDAYFGRRNSFRVHTLAALSYFLFFSEREGCEMCNILLATLQFSSSIRGTQRLFSVKNLLG